MLRKMANLVIGGAAAIVLATGGVSLSYAQSGHMYVVRSPDTLYRIAAAHGVTLASIEAANPQIKNFNDIWAGESIHLPPNRIGPGRVRPQSSVHGIIAGAKSFMGIKYVWGGSNPKQGFDCSGFVQYVFKQYGIHLPRQSHDQATVGLSVPRSRLKPGDLLFFSNTDSFARYYSNRVTHVAIYIGDGDMIESSSTHHDEGVTIIHNVFANSFYKSHYYGARDVLSLK